MHITFQSLVFDLTHVNSSILIIFSEGTKASRLACTVGYPRFAVTERGVPRTSIEPPLGGVCGPVFTTFLDFFFFFFNQENIFTTLYCRERMSRAASGSPRIQHRGQEIAEMVAVKDHSSLPRQPALRRAESKQ